MSPLKGFLCVILAFLAPVHSADWNYITGDDKGPANWGNDPDGALCNGNSQSPINIVPDDATYDDSLGEFTFNNYNPLPAGLAFNLLNKGYTWQVDFIGDNLPTISGGSLPGTYRLFQMHVHWGSDNTKGSEHTIKGEAFPAELHMVHMKNDYANWTYAKDQTDGLAVLGIMLEEGEGDNSDYAPLVDALSNIRYAEDDYDLSTFTLDKLLPDDTDEYYRYPGSLTTPPCNEIVIWTVFKEPVYLSTDQLAEFRMLYQNGMTNDTSDNTVIADNFRPVQDLNGRTVKTSFEVETGTASTATLEFKMFLISLAALWLYRN